MSTIIELFLGYWYMLLYHILRLPYAVRVFIGSVFLIIICFICVRLLLKIIKLIIAPLLILIAEVLIIIGTNILYILLHLKHNKTNIYTMDEKLNNCGIALTKLRKNIIAKKSHINRALTMKLFLVCEVAVIILTIVPYYTKDYFSDRVQSELCVFADKVLSFEERISKDIPLYYNPIKKDDEERISESTNDAQTTIDILHLNETGQSGTNLRSSPELRDDNIIGTVSGTMELVYLGEVVVDRKININWIKVRTDNIEEAWISHWQIEEKLENLTPEKDQ